MTPPVSRLACLLVEVQRLVVGAAVVHEGRVLAARRTAPPETAGRWELPGGKVEVGEQPADAVRREVAEELGCEVRVRGWLAPRVEVRAGLALVVAVVELVDGEPRPCEHDRLRWLHAAELDDVDWLDPDRPFLTHLARVLGGTSRAVLDDPDLAHALARDLERAGHAARVARDPLAGEDDDEDHPWTVDTAAPLPVLERLLEGRDGWLDPGPVGEHPPGVPLDLPRAPRRRHRGSH